VSQKELHESSARKRQTETEGGDSYNAGEEEDGRQEGHEEEEEVRDLITAVNKC
jgi:hypothetical protein